MNHRTIDVAKWNTSDIEGIMIEQGFDLQGKDAIDFIEAVVETLEVSFDASVGVNWDVIIDTVIDTAMEMGLIP